MKTHQHAMVITPLSLAAALTLASGQLSAELKTQTMEYQVNGTTFTGYMAYDDETEGKRPGVLVVHEWWGHNEFAREQAERLAEAGYTAFALDMYGSGKLAEHPEDAQAFMKEATKDMDQVKARFMAAKELLQAHDTVDSSMIAAQGYCFGGAVVLNMARLGVDLDAVVSYHGALGSPIKAEPGNVKPRIHVYTGGADKMVPSDQVSGLVKEMQDAEADLTLVNFPGVLHSFTNPGADKVAEEFNMPIAYNEEAANRSWEGTMRLYQEVFSN
ncbi:dienelactone hydrolase family protein [Marinobacter confluentis]|uniref:Dienelactone hydrolase family protein n=1 Tax=Marinobacter confluentis TaxID=1697557 RepID=A0A4Z1BH40_9GAMM|nr:dienelactone hydrolase family protein [Marinobacter confluentis]TGN38779.1 dienelactone hydrolase family protein [Marinobacter confluentis]